jgi:tRNA nucleotidyltransferase (CCA-adding enzyme)
MNMSEDLLSGLIKRVPGELSTFLQHTSTLASRQQLNLYLVGGIVRDIILDRPNFDIDLVLEGDAVEFADALKLDKSVATVVHRRFGTVKFKFDDYNIDIASARREVYAKPGALPDVTRGNIIEDLARRDFTINAMALKLSSEAPEKLLDPYGGITDLESKTVRILHDNSFRDDATRMFRAVRYEQRLDFSIAPETINLIQRDLNMVDTLSKDRIKHELQLFFTEHYPEKCIYRSSELGLLNKIHPALQYNDWMPESFKMAREEFKPAQLPVIYLCLLIYNLDGEQLEGFLNSYNFPRQQALKMRQTISLKTELVQLSRPGLKNWSVFSILRKYELPVIQINKMAVADESTGRVIDLYLNKLRYIRPQLTGEDLINLGVAQGVQIGHILNRLHTARVNGEVKSRADEIDMARELINSEGTTQ